MRRTSVLLVMVLLTAACSDEGPAESLDISVSDAAVTCTAATGITTGSLVGRDGIPRKYRVFVPSSGGEEALPVVLNFHGLGSSGDHQAAYSGYEQLGESEAFVVAHPTGGSPSGVTNSWELAQFDGPGRDDVEFVDSFIDFLADEYCIDTNRVYSTGMSNGALFSSQLICDLSDRIAAVVSVAGLTHYDDCAPTRPVPFMAIHGTADDVISFDGTGPTLIGPEDPPTGSFFAQVMPDEFAEFAADFGCEPVADISTIGDDVVEYRYVGCRGEVPLVFREVSGGGHVWPGSPFADELSSDTSFYTSDIDATTDGWNFLKQFTLSGD